MTDNAKYIVARLLALRSGLSLASKERDALVQAKEFSNAAKISGIILTKLDGTARGGVVLTIKHELGIPVKFVGFGEGIDDLQPFDAKQFTDALFQQ